MPEKCEVCGLTKWKHHECLGALIEDRERVLGFLRKIESDLDHQSECEDCRIARLSIGLCISGFGYSEDKETDQKESEDR